MAFGGFNFGSTSTAPAQTQPQAGVPQLSVTGPTPAQTPSPAPFSFGSTPSTTGGGLFGSTTNQQSQTQPQQQGGGLFGASSSTSTGGMFGSKPATTGNMFGGNTTQPHGQQTSLFGQPQQQQQQGTSLFGQPQPQHQPQQQSGGLFGQNQNQNQNQNQTQQGQQGQSSLFGSTSQQPQQQQSNSFGQKSTGLTLNQSSSSTGMNKGTKFTDLPEQHQKSIEQLDAAFRQQKQLVYGTLDSQNDLQRAIVQVSNDVKSAEAECTALHLGLRPLSRAYAQLSAKVKSEEEDLQRLADIWGSYRPSDGRPSNLRAGALRDFRKGYFRKVVQDSEERIPRYKQSIIELRRAVDSLQQTNEMSSPQAISQTIQNHKNAIYDLAAIVEGLEVRWNDVRGCYSQMYKDKTGSIRDPLDVAREQNGSPPVRA